MFPGLSEETSSSKCYVTEGVLPRHIDPEQPPTKVKPFSAIMSQAFTHTIDLILPKEAYDMAKPNIGSKSNALRYSRVFMSLSDILEGNFFNYYIKRGNIMMLSEGRPGTDSVFSLYEGVLRLDLLKEAYERTGLVGRSTQDGGRQHLKTRYVVEINLRQPSMVHGKKGFERIVWACKNVLSTSLSWLFCDIGFPTHDHYPDPLAKHYPNQEPISPEITQRNSARIPSVATSQAKQYDKEWIIKIHEWLSLVSLQSPRVEAHDSTDPYLCRYSDPGLNSAQVCDLVCIKWTGFFPAVWIRSLLIELCTLRKSFTGPQAWFALSAYAFSTEVINRLDGYTILGLPAEADDRGSNSDCLGSYVLWQCSSTT